MAKFINPYNFIPLGLGDGDKKNRKNREIEYRRNAAALKSGWLDIILEAKTPLIIPDGAHPEYRDCDTGKIILHPTEEQKKNAHKKYNFYKVEKESESILSIPGSELRGMVRSVYETITDSCFPFFMNDDMPLSQRIPVMGSFRDRGLLEYNKENNQWTLWKAIANKQKCQIQGNQIKYKGHAYKCGDYDQNYGYAQCNLPVSNKDKYHIAFLNPSQEAEYIWTAGDDTPFRMMDSVLSRDSVKGGQKNPNEKYTKSLHSYLKSVKKNGGMIPVWYLVVLRGDEKIVYMSNSSVGRIAQLRRWSDVFPHHMACSDSTNMCPACLLFGTVRGDGMRGKVRFSDADCITENPDIKPYILDVLGEPRVSAFEFYVQRPEKDAYYWNLDFYGRKVKDEKGKDRILYSDIPEATPRGRKMYWHGKENAITETSNMNATMEGVSVKTQFRFKLYFDQITEKQLEDLIWVITLGENTEDSTLQHKLGHAKPLGFGSVKLCVEGYHVRKLEMNYGIPTVKLEDKICGETPKCNFDTNSVQYRSLIRMCDTESVKDQEVRYPREIKTNRAGISDDKVFNWFTENRKKKSIKTLPLPTDKSITLEGNWLKNSTPEGNAKFEKNTNVAPKGQNIGKIIKLTDKGYGFIECASEKNGLFFHAKQLKGSDFQNLSVGDMVSYDIGIGDKGKVAQNVRLEE